MSQPDPRNESGPVQDLQPVASVANPTEPKKRSKGMLGGIGAMLAVLLGKLKFLAVLLKLGWISKLLLSGGSMLFMIAAYALVEPWPFAIGFVLLICIHEMGHLLVLRRYGLKASLPLFIPFIGAMVAMKDMPRDAYMEAKVAFGGPVLGGAAALGCLLTWALTRSPLFLHLAYMGFFLNLFNLTPIRPMDGGRIANAVSKWFLVAGLLIITGMILAGHFHPVLFLILFAGIGETIRRFSRNNREDPSYYAIGGQNRALIGAGYFALVCTLAYLSVFTYQLIGATGY
jgi:Zn-dependent protease